MLRVRRRRIVKEKMGATAIQWSMTILWRLSQKEQILQDALIFNQKLSTSLLQLLV
jgi:hypothetical protein